jgi:hypothetical protein
MMARTIYLARLIGLFLVLVAISMIVQNRWFIETEDALVHDRPVLWLAGVTILACGLAMVLAHNRWSGGLMPVVVTVVGWILLIKGILVLFLPPEMLVDLFGLMHVGQLVILYAAIDLVIGLYLTYAGFTAPNQS